MSSKRKDSKRFKITFLLLIFFVFSAYNPCQAEKYYTVQVAASKTPIDIGQFIKKNNIAVEITEIKGSDWIRYFAGHFNNYDSASVFAAKLLSETRLTNIFVRQFDDATGHRGHSGMEALAEQPTEPTPGIVTDTFQLNASIAPQEEPGTDTLMVNRINTEQNSNITQSVSQKTGRKSLPNQLFVYVNYKVIGEIQQFLKGDGEKIYGYPLVIFFFLFILLFGLNIITVLLILSLSNKKQNENERFIRYYRDLYENALLTYLLGESDWEKTEEKLKNSHQPANRALLSSILLNFHENLRGSANELVPDIFVKLGLHDDAILEARSKLYFEKVQGIRKLSYLYPEGAKEIIPGLLNDTDDVVRAEAQTAYVRIHPEQPFNFLRSLEKPFTRWTQISAFYLFRLHQLPVPSFVKYLDSPNTNVRNFSLRMITFFQQLENVPEILKMLESKAESTRFLAIRAVNDLRLYDGKELLKKMYQAETGKNKTEILKAFKNIGNEEDFQFLESILLSDNVSLKTEACRALYYMGEEGKEKLMEINRQMNQKLDLYIAHVTDQRN